MRCGKGLRDGNFNSVTEYVVDASVAVKWFLDEDGHAEADILSGLGARLIAPSFILLEMANVLWKQQRRGVMDRAVVTQMLSKAPQYFSEFIDGNSLVVTAMELACDHEHPVYDCLYLALTLERDCKLVTADHKLLSRFAKTPLANHFLSLSSFAR